MDYMSWLLVLSFALILSHSSTTTTAHKGNKTPMQTCQMQYTKANGRAPNKWQQHDTEREINADLLPGTIHFRN